MILTLRLHCSPHPGCLREGVTRWLGGELHRARSSECVEKEHMEAVHDPQGIISRGKGAESFDHIQESQDKVH